MKKLLITSFAAAALLASPAMEGTAEAGIGSCIKSAGKIIGGVKATVDAGKKIKKACEAPKSCKKDCKTKGANSFCAQFDDEAACKKEYKKFFKDYKKYVKAEAKVCKKRCKSTDQALACRKARWKLVGTAAKSTGKIVLAVGECAPFPGFECVTAVDKCLKAGKELSDGPLGDAFRGVKAGCAELRNCKKDARKSKKGCISDCKKDHSGKGRDAKKAKKDCKKSCREGKASEIMACKDKFVKDDGTKNTCRPARKELWKQVRKFVFEQGKKGRKLRECLSALNSCRPI